MRPPAYGNGRNILSERRPAILRELLRLAADTKADFVTWPVASYQLAALRV